MRTHKGTYRVKNREKYLGDPDNVVYRSGWERDAFVWCDKSPNVIEWNSEEMVIPYICATDNRPHRYFVDLFIVDAKGVKWLIEIKPHKETQKPVAKGKTKKSYLSESMTYIKNQSKWKYAEEFAKKNGMKFAIWTEHELKKLGIMKTLKKAPWKKMSSAVKRKKKPTTKKGV